MKYIILFFLCLYINVAIPSTEVVNTKAQNTTIANTKSKTNLVGTAIDWNLSNDEWNRYIILMQGPAGRYYSQLTPPEVLGHYAENDQELRHYAEISAKQEHDKVERELKFNLAFHEAASNLYKNEEIIKPFNFLPFTPIQVNEYNPATTYKKDDHIVMFINAKDSVYSPELNKLIQVIKENQNVVLDIYCVNALSEKEIQDWARANKIPMNLTISNHITLNANDGKFEKIVQHGQLPYALLVRDGVSKPLDIGSI